MFGQLSSLKKLMVDLEMAKFIFKHTKIMIKIAKISTYVLYAVIVLGYFAGLQYWFWLLLATALVRATARGALKAYKTKIMEMQEDYQ